MPPERAVAIARQIADGLSHCHQQGIVHRDLKPENILVNAEGQPIIMDFGLALTKGAQRVTYPNLSATAGTPDYMAPEQVEGQRGDPRTDIYALGVILFEMLSGQTPFTGDNNLAVMAMRLTTPPPRLDHIRPDVPPELAAIVARCLQRDPDARYPDMRALIEALDHPETVDLSILDRTATKEKALFLRSPVMTAIIVSILLMIALVVLALILQMGRP